MVKPTERLPAFVDYETFWDVGYSLRSPKISTTDYIHDKRFEIHGASVARCDAEPRWLRGPELQRWLEQARNDGMLFVGHHVLFDGYISTHIGNVEFDDYFCTMGMIEALFQGAIGRGLDEAMTTLLGWDTGKTDILTRTKGLYWGQMTEAQQNKMATYANKDLKGTQELFYTYAAKLPREEWRVMSTVLKMFCHPRLEFDKKLLTSALQHAHDDRDSRIENALAYFNCTEKDLSGNNTFIKLLTDTDCIVPMKPSPSVEGKMIPAFAKTDQGFQDLLEHMDPRVQALAEGRQAVKSTQGITRAQRFLDLHESAGILPVAYNYYRAHTGRLSGGNKINLANLKTGSDLRRSVVAPDGFVLAVADSSQIECRDNGYLAGQTDLIDLLRAKEDPYNDMASIIYSRKIDRKLKTDKMEGFIGKTCFASNTIVLTNRGPQPIIKVKSTDKLWDGTSWVTHRGLVYQGIQNVMEISNLRCTPDHKILCGTTWIKARYLAHPGKTRSLALATGQENLLSLGGFAVLGADVPELSSSVIATQNQNTASQQVASKISNRHDAMLVRRKKERKSAIGSTLHQCLMTLIELVYSIDYLPRSHGVTIPKTKLTLAMEAEVSMSSPNGETTDPHSSNISRHVLAGTTPRLKWTAQTMILGIFQGISDSLPVRKIRETAGRYANSKQQSKNYEPVYDLANAGPNHRFTVLTNIGPLIVHNCVLGLGFQMGGPKFKWTCEMGAKTRLGINYEIELDEAYRIVNVYRHKNYKIVQSWERYNEWLHRMVNNDAPFDYDYGDGYFHIIPKENKVYFPNGTYLYYPCLSYDDGAFTYVKKLGKKYVSSYIYGGKFCENIVQKHSRDIVAWQMLNIAERYRVVLHTYDENVALVPESEAEEGTEWIINEMKKAPSWAASLPLDAEGGFAREYSK